MKKCHNAKINRATEMVSFYSVALSAMYRIATSFVVATCWVIYLLWGAAVMAGRPEAVARNAFDGQ